ncbi:MAG: gamma-glutamyl-gamma-aminobutyrate hydrolase family protein [Ignavibacteriales bacterium]|nr:gamma-glutamyl-gamma-aminobutyrate hydrolase family protein [Ignavibacteriales bacterium]
MIIGITDTMVSEDKFNYYIKWLNSSDIHPECVKLSYVLDNLSEIEKCDSLLLTGGNDVDPILYNEPTSHSKILDVDRKRDDFERKLFDRALERNIPVLAICRGMQLVNVHLGGTLIPDIEEAGFRSHRCIKNAENRHGIVLKENSHLRSIARKTTGMVNSSHHQAIDRIGRGLDVVAHSDDGIIEAMEWKNNSKDSFFLLVQWHPERMNDANNPLAGNILEKFLSESN